MGILGTPTLEALAEVITGGSGSYGGEPVGIYRTGSDLVGFFRNVNIEFNLASRVPSTREALERINEQPDGIKLLARVVEKVCDPRIYLHMPQKCIAIVEYLNARLEYDNYQVCKVDKFYKLLGTGTSSPVVDALGAQIDKYSMDSVRTDFDNALELAESKPWGAIRAACTTVESLCKHLLDEMSEPYPAKKDIEGLVQAVQKRLNLHPSRTDTTEDIKRILGGLVTVAGGIGALRTHGSDAHGRGKDEIVPVDARIARLTIHAASTISLFFIETWEKRK